MTSLSQLILNVTGITCLVAAVTVAARIPRLTRRWGWRLAAAFLFLLFAGLYVFLTDAPTRAWLGFRKATATARVEDVWEPTMVTLIVAAAIVAFSSLSWKLRRPPDFLAPLLRGVRPLTIPGSIAAIALVIHRMLDQTPGRTLWPVILGSAAFLYLWWLAIRLFDLVFVWHRYTRAALLQRYLAEEKIDSPQRQAVSRP